MFPKEKFLDDVLENIDQEIEVQFENLLNNVSKITKKVIAKY